MLIFSCWNAFLRFRLLVCLMVICTMGCLGSCQNVGGVPIRVTRSENMSDRFVNSKSNCHNALCGAPKSSGLEGAKKDGSSCVCQCPNEFPIFQDDISTCVQQIPESGGCPNSALFDGKKHDINPVVQLPPFGHTINRQIIIQLSDLNFGLNVIRRCWVDDAQFLSPDGWNAFSAIRLGSQPPRFKMIQQFVPAVAPPVQYVYQPVRTPTVDPMVYDLQWLGSSEHAEFLQGRIILLTVTCNSTGLPSINLCFPMRIAGAFGRLRSLALVDTASNPNPGTSNTHEGDHVETGVLVAAACGGALGVLYVIVLAIFIASRLRKSQKAKEQCDQRQTPSHYDGSLCGDLEKNNPIAPLDTVQISGEQGREYNATSYAAWPEDMAFRHRLLQLHNRNQALLPMRYLYSPPPFFLNDIVIVQTPDVICKDAQMQDVINRRLENKTLPKPPVRRRKLFFDPRYFDVDHLKHPTDEAESFRAQIHCMINVTKSRLDKRRFLPNLEMIDEESLGRRTLETVETVTLTGRKVLDGKDELGVCIEMCPPSRSSGKLDAVVLQVRKPSPILQPKLEPPSDWSQILKDEWGSNESLPKIPHRRRIHEVFQKNWGAITGSRSSLATDSLERNAASKNSHGKVAATLVVVEVDEISDTRTKIVSEDEDRHSDKSSNRSGSNPENKDSGIEDDGGSDKSKKLSSQKIVKGPDNVPSMISRKKIVSATVGNGQTLVKTRPNGSLRDHPKQAVFS